MAENLVSVPRAQLEKDTIPIQWALLAVVVLAQAAVGDDHPERFLPLRVNNLWMGYQNYFDITESEAEPRDWTMWTEYIEKNGWFTLKVERTEVIDDKTYYVISDMPEKWPPVPEFFIAGKRLRWEGASLMERTADGEQPLLVFGLPGDSEYEVIDRDGQIIPVATTVRVRRLICLLDPAPGVRRGVPSTLPQAPD